MTNLNKSQQEQLELNSFLVEAARQKLLNFAQLLNPKYEAIWFHELIAQKLEDALEKVANKGKVRMILSVPPRHGKEILSTTLVPTPDGFKEHGNLKVGDYVFHPSGKPVKVLNIIPQPEPATLEVLFTDGSKVTVHPNHEWTVKDRRSGDSKLRTIETHQMVGNEWIGSRGIRGSRARFLIPYTKPVQIKKRPVPVDPYTFGVWLGNGTATDTRLITFNPDSFEEQLSYIPYKPTWIYWHKTQFVPRARFGDMPKHSYGKMIPDEYLFNSEEVRRELLAGLIDTDGHVDKTGRVHFVNTNKLMIDRLAILVNSLGYRSGIVFTEPRLSTSGILGKKIVYTLSFSVHDGRQVAKLKYKKIKKFALRRMRGVVSVTPVTGGKGECITVDSIDGLYLVTENFITTHNSELTSVLFPAWALGKHPDMQFILSTYGMELAEKHGMKTRDVINNELYSLIFPGIHLRSDTKAKAKWMTNKNGSFTAVGTGSAITGSGGNFIVLDDPHKDRAEAESQVSRESTWEYFQSTLYSRLEGAGGIIVVAQRWHADDLIGRLKEEEEKLRLSGQPHDEWEIVNFPAIAEEDEYIEGEKVRSVGEALWPSKFSVDVLKNIAAKDIYNWSSQYQQDPILAANQEFKQHHFKYYKEEELSKKFLRFFTFVDPAISQKKTADNTVIATVAKEVNGPNWYRIREDAGKFTPSQTVDLIFLHHKEYRSEVYLETVAYQMALKYSIMEEQKLRQMYFLVHEVKTTSNKEMRIRGLLPMYTTGVIYHREGVDFEYEREALAFPRGKHDDRLDAMAQLLLVENPHGGQVAKQYRKKFTGYFSKRG